MNALIQWDGHPVVYRLGWTLLHFLWQGAVIAGLFAIAQTGLRSRSSNARYLTGCLALALMLAAPVLTFIALGTERAVSVARAESGTLLSAANPSALFETAGTPVLDGQSGQGGQHGQHRAQIPPPPNPQSAARLSSPKSIRGSTELAEVNPQFLHLQPEKFIPGFVLAWLLGVSALSLRLLFSSLQVARLKRLRHEPPGAPWLERLDRLKAALQISRPVRLVKSALVEVPAVVGWLRPVILLPAATLAGLTPAQLEAILAHELAHIRRHDYLVNLLQNALETLLFYHPAVWWVSSCVRAEREICCDEIAVRVCGDRVVYAKALAALEQLRAGGRSLALGADGSSLLERIRRLSGAPSGGNVPARRRTGGALVAGLVAILLVCLLHHPSSNAKAMESTASPDLTGTVRGPANQPITNATVSIYAATPKADWGVESRSSEDCQKGATTDTKGKFTIKALDPNALFRVLILAKDFRPMFVWSVDPAAKGLDATLKPVSSGALPEEQVRGRVVGPDGKPISGALVNIYGARREKEGWREPPWEDIDGPVFTDDSGEFVIHGQLPFIACDLTVEARGFAKSGRQEEVHTGGAVHEFRLTEGASLKGRLLKDGKPLANASIGISGVKTDVFNREFSAATDGEGRFSFVNIPPHREYYLFGIMRSLQDRGALSVRRVRVEGDGSSLDVGDLNLEPSFTLAGVARLANGQPAPANWTVTLYRTVMTPPPPGEPPPTGPGSREFLGLEDNLDSWRGEIGRNGQFQFSGVPAETVSLGFMVTFPYKLSQRNASADTTGYRLLGRVVTNKTDLVIEFEPNERQEKPAPLDYQALSQKPLRGVEAGERTPAATNQTNAASGPGNSSTPAENPSGISLVIRCVTNVFKVGDEIPIEFIVSNHGTKDNTYTEPIEGRDHLIWAYKLIARTSTGENVPDPDVARWNFGLGGVFPSTILHPGESFARTIPLNYWALMREPGAYEVVGTYFGDPHIPDTTNEPMVPVKSGPITITVLPRTKQEMNDYIMGLTNQIAARLAAQTSQDRGKYDGVLQKLFEKLTYTCSPEIVPSLLEIWDNNSVASQWAARALLFYVPHTEAIRKAIIEAAAKHDLKHDFDDTIKFLLPVYDRNSEEIKTITPPSSQPSRNTNAGKPPPATPNRTNAAPGPASSSKPATNSLGISLEIRCTNEVLKVGDEIPIEFIISNHGKEDYKYVERSGDLFGTGAGYELSAKTSSGENVAAPSFSGMVGTVGNFRVLHPGASFTRILPLNICASMTEPGRYEVVGTYRGEKGTVADILAAYLGEKQSHDPLAPVSSDPITITVSPRTKEEMHDYVIGLTNRIAARLSGAKQNTVRDDPALDELLKKLMYTYSPEMVPTLLDIIYEEEVPGDEIFLAMGALLHFVPDTEETRKLMLQAAVTRGLTKYMVSVLWNYDHKEELMKLLMRGAPASLNNGEWRSAYVLASDDNDEASATRLIAIASGTNTTGNARNATISKKAPPAK